MTPANANVLASRLTYDSNARSGEVFGRIDTPANLFVKGFIGGGDLGSGHLNDEDWVIFNAAVPYSNTISEPVQGRIAYGTIDVGYDVFRQPGQKLGSSSAITTTRRTRTPTAASRSRTQTPTARPRFPIPFLGITENDTWQSLRVGVNAEVMVMPGLKLTGDVAYLPYVRFDGLDIHWLRNVGDNHSPETGKGRGVQLETILSYFITPAFSVGVGGRYWAMWTNDSAYTNIFGTACPCQTLPSKTQRAGVFLQGAYKFNSL